MFSTNFELAKLSCGGKQPKLRWPLVAAGTRLLPRTWKLASSTIASARLIAPEGPAYCIWEVREGISAEQFQEFIDGPNGVNFGLGAWMNICREINLELAGTPPYPRNF